MRTYVLVMLNAYLQLKIKGARFVQNFSRVHGTIVFENCRLYCTIAIIRTSAVLLPFMRPVSYFQIVLVSILELSF